MGLGAFTHEIRFMQRFSDVHADLYPEISPIGIAPDSPPSISPLIRYAIAYVSRDNCYQPNFI